MKRSPHAQSIQPALDCRRVGRIGVCSAAQTFGQISGQVTDASGGILVGATVVVTNTQTNAVREAVTNSAGSYVFPNLLPGV